MSWNLPEIHDSNSFKFSCFIRLLVLFIFYGISITTFSQQNTIIDTTPGSAINDGTIGVDEYVGFSTGINADFGDLIGSGSKLYIDSDTQGKLNIALEAGTTTAWNDIIVIYIDTPSGNAFTSTSSLSDGTDPHREAISVTVIPGSQLTFAPGFTADYAIAINSSYAGIWELTSGTLNFIKELDLTVNNVSGDYSFELSGLNLSDIGVLSGGTFDYVATLINSINGWRANEFHGVSGSTISGTIGTSSTSLASGDYNTFISIPTFKLLSISPTANQNNVPRDANITLTFDQNIDGSTIENGTPNDYGDDNILITAKHSGVLEGTWSGDGTNTISFTPDIPFRSGETITVKVLDQLRGVNNSRLLIPFHLDFKVLSSLAPEQPPVFTDNLLTDAVSAPRSTISIDLDLDGDLDLVSGSYTNGTITWQENDGTQNFTSHPIPSSSTLVIYIYGSDIDLDGDIDIVTSSYLDNRIVWYENDGSQQFVEHVIPITTTYVHRLNILDMDGDGDNDIQFTQPTNQVVSWLENDGSEQFTLRNIATTNIQPFAAAVGDIDGDGDIDLATAATSDNIHLSWYENTGGMAFSEHAFSTTVATNIMDVEMHDVDDDGDLDLLIAANSDFRWYENDGSQGFSEHMLSGSEALAISIEAGDPDGDGDQDIATASWTSGKVSWFENDGLESFTEHILATQANADALDLIDLEQDGDIDMIYSGAGANEIKLLENADFLTLKSFSPNQNQINVPRDANITLTFDQNIDGTTIDGGTPSDFSDDNIIVRGEQTGIISGVWTGGGTSTLIFDPTIDLKAGEKIIIDIGPGLTAETSGDSFRGPLSSYFVTSTDPAPESPLILDKNVLSNSISYPRGIFSIDLDQDGDIDFLSSASGEANITWHENDGHQHFSETQLSLSSGGAPYVQGGDIDNDGDNDILASGFNKLTWFENDGGQGFTEHVLPDNIGGLHRAFLRDMDGDMDLDIMATSGVANEQILWFENDGNQNFTKRVVSASGVLLYAANVGDIDGDGDMDIASSTAGNTVSWFENDGHSGFTENTITASGISDIRDVEISDIDDDGDADLFYAAYGDFIWYENDGNENFTEHILSTPENLAIDISVGDIDGDGDQDIVTTSYGNGRLAWYENDGEEAFTRHILQENNINGLDGLSLVDLDLDLDLDIVYAQGGSNEIGWYENMKQMHVVSNLPASNAINVSKNATIILNFDLTIDGTSVQNGTPGDYSDDNILILSNRSGYVEGSWSGSGTTSLEFTPSTPYRSGESISVIVTDQLRGTNNEKLVDPLRFTFIIESSPSPEQPTLLVENLVTDQVNFSRDVITADMDGDGDLDVLYGSYTNGDLTWLENTGSPEFSIVHDISTTISAVTYLYGKDLDRDGDMDIITTTYGTNQITWYVNNGNEMFTEKVLPIAIEGIHRLEILDMDGDGDIDILTPRPFANYLSWLENDGSEQFTLRNISTTNYTSFAAAASDMDEDGDMDIVSSSSADNTHLSWYENQGDMTFTEHPFVATVVSNVRDVKVNDLNADGHFDLVFALDNQLRWYENDGTFSFTEHILSGSESTVISVEVGDIDGDGDLDIAANPWGTSKVSWYENEGSSNFTEHIQLTSQTYADGLEIVDLDEDDDLDLLFSSGGINKISWLENVSVLNLVSATPLSHEQDVPRDANITLTFDQNIDGASIEAGTPGDFSDDHIIIRGEQTGIISGTWSGAGTTTLTFDPDNDFKAGEVITTTIQAGLTGQTSGETLLQPVTRRFTVDVLPSPESPTLFSSNSISKETVGAHDLYAVDIDQDGYMDLLSASYIDNHIRLFRNQGNEDFEEQVINSAAMGTRSVSAADVDSDGEVDIISTSYDDGKIAWYKNDGTEQFTEQPVQATGLAIGAHDAIASDIDGDGDIDIIGALYDADRIVWYENDGSEDFSSQHDITTTVNEIRSLHAADIDNDGDVDIISSSAAGNKIAWHENVGTFVFPEHTITNSTDHPTSIHIADVDSDGDLDIVATSQIGDKVFWYENEGDPDFAEHLVAENLDEPIGIYASDVDGDGTMDILVSLGLGNEVIALLNDGNEVFTKQLIETVNYSPDIIAADMDNDGDADIVAAIQNGNEVRWYENTNLITLDSYLPTANTINVPRDANITLTFSEAIEASSIDGSTPEDFSDDNIIIRGENSGLIMGSWSGGGSTTLTFDPDIDFKYGENITVVVTRGLVGSTSGDNLYSSTTFQFTTVVDPAPESPPVFNQSILTTNADGPVTIDVVDFNNDGHLDLVTASRFDNEIAWYENDGNQSYDIEHIISSTATDAHGLKAVDFDLDGDMDVIGGLHDGDKVVWYKNEGSLPFTEVEISTLVDNVVTIHVVDVNQDGHLDVLSASINDDKIAWYENHGDETFTQHVLSVSVDGAHWVDATDVDGDGDLDILGASVLGNRIMWFENTGNASFVEVTPSLTVTGAAFVSGVDVDQDGHMDILATTLTANEVIWFQNDGSQGFTKNVIASADGPRSIEASDVDGDGDLDLISASAVDDKVALYENDGSENFTERLLSLGADGARYVLTVDLDLDGDMDVISASEFDDEISWYENVDLIPSMQYASSIDISKKENVFLDGPPLSISSEEMGPTGITFNDIGTKMFVIGQNDDEINQYTLSIPFDITSGVSFEGHYDVSSEETFPNSLTFNKKGTKMFIVGNENHEINQYRLLSPFDITTGVIFEGSPFDLTSELFFPQGITFSNDGRKMFILGSLEINQYNLLNAFDVTSGVTFDGNPLDLSSDAINPRELIFNNDGTKMFVVGSEDDEVDQYSLTTPFDITNGVSFDGNSFDVSMEETNPVGIAFDNKGTKMFIVGGSIAAVNQYTLNSNVFNEMPTNNGSVNGSMIISISNDTFVNPGGSLNLSSHYTISNLPPGLLPSMDVAPDGLTASLTLSGTSTELVDIADLQFTFTDAAFTNSIATEVDNAINASSNLGIDFNERSLTYSISPDITDAYLSSNELTISGFPAGMAFNDDGTKVYLTDVSGPEIDEYDLSSAYDLSTGIFVTNHPITDETYPQDIVFNPAGTSMFLTGVGSKNVIQYDLTQSFDLTTAQYSKDFPVSIYENNPQGLRFSPQGTKMFIVGVDGEVNEFTLSTAFDLGSVSYSQTFILTSSESYPTGIEFNANGTKMYIIDRDEDEINQYNLSTPFNIGTAVFEESISILNDDGSAFSILLDPSGTDFYVMGTENLKIITYQLNSNAFVETSTNDGSVEGSMILSLSNDSFVDPGGSLTTPTHFTIDNLPTGLSPSLQVGAGGTSASLELAGNANDHESINDISGLEFTFTDAAFINSPARSISNATGPGQSGLGISFDNDTDPPLVQVFTPLNGSSNFSVDGDLVIDFDEDVVAGTGNITIKKLIDDSDIEIIDVLSGQVTFNSDLTTINPTNDLPDAEGFYVLLDNTAIEDLVGNAYAGISGNSTWAFSTIDITPPDVITQEITIALDENGMASINPDQIDNGSSDNVTAEANLLMSLDITDFNCTDIGNHTVTLTVTDEAGNINQNTAVVTVADELAPVPELIDLADVLGECLVNSTTAPTAMDNCDGSINGVADVTFPLTESTTITWTFTDGSGNEATQTQNVIIEDAIAPVPDVIVLIDLQGQCEVAASTAPTATDNCDGQITGVADQTFPITTSSTITWSYTDLNGNLTTQTQEVIVEDTNAPDPDVATLTDLTNECEVTLPTSPTATDNCDGSINGVADVIFPLTESTIITWTFTDGSGNEITQNQNVVIDDVTSPIPDASVLADLQGQCEVTAPTVPTATDICDGQITGVADQTFPITTSSTIIWSYTDLNGNLTTQTQEVIVEDTNAPDPNVATLTDLTNECEVTLPTSPTATDNCDGSINGVADVIFPLTESTIITWTFTDGSGNETTQTQNVIIDDVTSPIPDASVLADLQGQCEVTAPTAPTATDNCDGPIEGVPDLTFPIISSTTITWSFTDKTGNVSTQTQNVVVEDTEPPIAIAKNITIDLVDGTASITAEDIDDGSSDNCSVELSLSQTNFTFDDVGDNIVVLTATDGAANNSTDEATVTVFGNRDPVILEQSFELDEKGPVGTVIGTVEASDPDDDALTFAILSGNRANAFAINSNTGTITISNATAIRFNINPVFDLIVEVNDGNGGVASATVSVTLNKILGVGNSSLSDDIQIYPNPTDGIVSISSDEFTSKEFTLTILNVGGLSIGFRILEKKSNEIIIDLGENARGIYLLSIRIDEHMIYKRIHMK